MHIAYNKPRSFKMASKPDRNINKFVEMIGKTSKIRDVVTFACWNVNSNLNITLHWLNRNGCNADVIMLQELTDSDEILTSSPTVKDYFKKWQQKYPNETPLNGALVYSQYYLRAAIWKGLTAERQADKDMRPVEKHVAILSKIRPTGHSLLEVSGAVTQGTNATERNRTSILRSICMVKLNDIWWCTAHFPSGNSTDARIKRYFLMLAFISHVKNVDSPKKSEYGRVKVKTKHPRPDWNAATTATSGSITRSMARAAAEPPPFKWILAGDFNVPPNNNNTNLGDIGINVFAPKHATHHTHMNMNESTIDCGRRLDYVLTNIQSIRIGPTPIRQPTERKADHSIIGGYLCNNWPVTKTSRPATSVTMITKKIKSLMLPKNINEMTREEFSEHRKYWGERSRCDRDCKDICESIYYGDDTETTTNPTNTTKKSKRLKKEIRYYYNQKDNICWCYDADKEEWVQYGGNNNRNNTTDMVLLGGNTMKRKTANNRVISITVLG